jgi:hypothetical protein
MINPELRKKEENKTLTGKLIKSQILSQSGFFNNITTEIEELCQNIVEKEERVTGTAEVGAVSEKRRSVGA